MGIFARAGANLNLTPGERAFLKLVGGLVGTAVIAAILAVAQVLSGTPAAAVNWQTIAHVGAGAFAAALWSALAKFYKAHGDPALPDVGALTAGAAIASDGGAGAGAAPAPAAGR